MQNPNLVHNIRVICKRQGRSVSQVESKLGWSPGLISRWTKTYPSFEKVVALVNELGITFEELLNLDGEKGAEEEEDKSSILEKLAEETKSGKVDWRSAEEDPEALKLAEWIGETERVYFHVFRKARFLLAVRRENEEHVPALYIAPGHGMPPQLEAENADELFQMLQCVDQELYDQLASEEVEKIRAEFLNE